MADPVAKLQAVQGRQLAQREENRRRFPTVAQWLEDLKMFRPVVMEAAENGNKVRAKGFVEGVGVIPYIDIRRAHRSGMRAYPWLAGELIKQYGRNYVAQLRKENEEEDQRKGEV